MKYVYLLLSISFTITGLYGMDFQEEDIESPDVEVMENASDVQVAVVEALHHNYKSKKEALRRDMERGVGRRPYHARLQEVKNLFNKWKMAKNELKNMQSRPLSKPRIKQQKYDESMPS